MSILGSLLASLFYLSGLAHVKGCVSRYGVKRRGVQATSLLLQCSLVNQILHGVDSI